LLKAAKTQGLTKKTTVTALFDGASNCRNAVNILESHCLKINCILNWFHIAEKLKVLENCLLYSTHYVLQEIKKKLWKDKAEEALKQILSLVKFPLNKKGLERAYKFYDFIKENKANLINYNERHHAHLPYTSHAAESTVEHLLNQRLRRKQKMQWSRKGADNVLQIRSTIASDRWQETWKQFITNEYKIAA